MTSRRTGHACQFVNASHDPKRVKPVQCHICAAPDSRFGDHYAGCPELTPLPKWQLYALALQVQAGWGKR